MRYKHQNPILPILLGSILLFGIFSVFSQDALAQKAATENAGTDMLGFLDTTASKSGLGSGASVYDIIATIINTVLGLTGIIFFIQVFWAGFRWMTAGGADETIKTAKQTIVNSVIGIAIALSAFVITNFVLNKIEEMNGGGIQVTPSPATPLTTEPMSTGLGKCIYKNLPTDTESQCLEVPQGVCDDMTNSAWSAEENCP